MTFVYLTLEQVLETHRLTVEYSGGGEHGHYDLQRLEGVLAHIQNDDYYPTFEEKLTHLFYSACQFHCFVDGNKRIAITLCTQMLLLNGRLDSAKTFLHDMENISYHVAAGRIDKDLLLDIIRAHLNAASDDEELKLRILQAISGD